VAKLTDKQADDKVISLPSDSAHRLAFVLRAIEDEERAFAETRTAHKDTMERLHNLVYKMRQEILTGQLNLIDIAEKVAAEVNAGALDTKDSKVTAEVRKAAQ
jgi:hypothetical protein